MKKVLLFLTELKGSIFVNIILFVILTGVIFLTTLFSAQYTYINHTYKTLEKGKYDGGLYFTGNTGFLDFGEYADDKKLIEEIKEFACVEDVISEYSSNIKYFPNENNTIIQRLRFLNENKRILYPELKEGKWFDKAVNEDGSINAVVGGHYLYDRKPGDKLNMTIFGQNGKDIEINVTGVFGVLAPLPGFTSYGTYIYSEDLFSEGISIVLIDDELLNSDVLNLDEEHIGYDVNHIIRINKNAEGDSLSELKDFLKENGTYTEMNTIMEDSKEKLDENRLDFIIRPLFVIVVVFFGFISTAALSSHKRIKGNSILYLAGATKRTIILFDTMRFSIIAVLAAVLNLVFTNSYDVLYVKDIVDLGSDIMFDGRSDMLIILLAAAMIIITSIIGISVINKKSPTDVLREYKE